MKKREIFGLWLCLLGLFLLGLGIGEIAYCAAASFPVFAVGSIMILYSLWSRRKEP